MRRRPMNRPIYDPVQAGNSLTVAPWKIKREASQMAMLEKQRKGEGDQSVNANR